ncbi:BRO family protein [Desulfovibrio piger]|nr:BRO family protein [Desulfovibrio piger]
MGTALTFNGVTLTPIIHQHSLWIRAAELARALGYAQENSVSRLYRNNADEFTPEMTQVIEMSVESRNGSSENLLDGRCRIFSLRGCHLVAMFARTPVAKAFRRWVLDVLEKYAAEQQPSRPLVEDMVLPEPELPAAERLPLFRNGCFYLPGINKNHVPGPREAALMDLWQTWNRQTASMEREFMSMMRELERRRGDLFAVAVSELGRNADTAFSFESLMEGLFCAHDMALRHFKEAITLQRLSIRLSVNVAVALGR